MTLIVKLESMPLVKLKLVHRTIEAPLPKGTSTYYTDDDGNIFAKVIVPDATNPASPWQRTVSWYRVKT